MWSSSLSDSHCLPLSPEWEHPPRYRPFASVSICVKETPKCWLCLSLSIILAAESITHLLPFLTRLSFLITWPPSCLSIHKRTPLFNTSAVWISQRTKYTRADESCLSHNPFFWVCVCVSLPNAPVWTDFSEWFRSSFSWVELLCGHYNAVKKVFYFMHNYCNSPKQSVLCGSISYNDRLLNIIYSYTRLSWRTAMKMNLIGHGRVIVGMEGCSNLAWWVVLLSTSHFNFTDNSEDET